MTVPTTTSVITYLGNGVTTTFSFPFIGVSGNDLEVILTNPAGLQTTLPTNQYTLAINGTPVGGLWGIGGTVTYPISGSPIAVGYLLTINRKVPFEQLVSISNQGAFYPQSVEQALDLIEMQLQQLETTASYAIQAPIVDHSPPNVLPAAAARANGILGFDSNGQPIIVTTGALSPGTYANPRRVSTSGTSTIGLTTADSFGGISVYQAGGSVTTVQLPSTGGPYTVFDGSVTCNTLPIRVLPPLGQTILGSSSYLINFNGQSITFYLDGNQVLVG